MSYVHDAQLDKLEEVLESYKNGDTNITALIQACSSCNMDDNHPKPADWAAARLALRALTGD